MAALRRLRQMLCVLPLAALAACNGGIERGDKIEYLLMIDKSSTTPVALPVNADFQSYLCLRQQLGIIAVFSRNGSVDYSERPGTIWSSDNENVVHVSNGDDIIPSIDPTVPARYYPKGTIKPIAPGFATITADYVGIKTSVTVHVQSPSSIILSTSPFDASSNASTAPPLSIATGSTQQYYAYATLPNAGGQANVSAIKDVTGNATWSLLEDPDKTFASITNPALGTLSGGGLVTGISPVGPLTVNAHFTACEGTSFGDVDVTSKVQVSDVSSIKVSHDQAFIDIANPGYVPPAPPAVPNPPNPPLPLVIGTNEAFRAIATLRNGDTQDLSYQATFTTKTGNSGILSAFVGNLATALTLGTTQVTATFAGIDSNPAVTVQTQNATLNNFKIAAADKNQSIPAGGFRKYHVQGTYIAASGGGSFVQDMTYSAVWASSNPAIVAIGNAGMLVGVAISQNTNQDCVTISATSASQNPDGSKNDSTILGVAGPVVSGCEN